MLNVLSSEENLLESSPSEMTMPLRTPQWCRKVETGIILEFRTLEMAPVISFSPLFPFSALKGTYLYCKHYANLALLFSEKQRTAITLTPNTEDFTCLFSKSSLSSWEKAKQKLNSTRSTYSIYICTYKNFNSYLICWDITGVSC